KPDSHTLAEVFARPGVDDRLHIRPVAHLHAPQSVSSKPARSDLRDDRDPTISLARFTHVSSPGRSRLGNPAFAVRGSFGNFGSRRAVMAAETGVMAHGAVA